MSIPFPRFTIFYFLLALIEIAIEITHFEQALYYIKPSLLIILSIFFFVQTINNYNRFAYLMQFGFFFSLLGDIALMFVKFNQLYFLIGLVSFLIAHVFYIIGFIDNIRHSKEKTNFVSQLKIILPFILFSGTVLFSAKNNLGEMLVPVIVYTSALTLMCITAALRYNLVSKESYKFVLFGAMLFLFSDATIGINKFIFQDFPFASVIIMSLYYIGQYFIAMGAISYINKEGE